ncbi:hypothetical protein NBRC10512_001785 [Rhodotorula toruloides]|uniref:RHTO0S03e02630g1_1 n=2 Tax=Rhodotorula toruloides TaxID=5286 RepID=A0A061AKG8_RHOTO|nr:uncharacterized protein RHTO_00151 [Rhodotorula toruloides NP11]EMS25723.1 hypothetical protein RHTO_00151 [Rhodotorula toruloides NP11]CDR38059.1 RHTO0S03e02630g1_1 [Rhodotorula toruloides]
MLEKATHAAEPLTATNSRLALSLYPPHDSTCFTPGTTIYPTVRIKGDASYEHLSLRLVGEARVTVWGKARWQAGAVMNATMGGPAGGVPVTSIERRQFVCVDIPLTSSSNARAAAYGGDIKEKGSAEGLPEEGVYEVQVPYPEDGELLPSFDKKETDNAGASVVWYLELEGARKGWFRANDKLKLELPVALPVQATPQSLETTVHRDLKFQGNDSSALAVTTKLTCEPITTPASTLHFSLALTPSTSSAFHLLSSALSSSSSSSSDATPLKASSSLSRQVRTAPIVNPNSGTDFKFASIRIATGTLEHDEKLQGERLVWRGEVQVPQGDWTVESKGLDVKYTLNCHLHSTVFAQAALHISLPLFLPSAPAPVDLSASDQPVASSSALPPYSVS